MDTTTALSPTPEATLRTNHIVAVGPVVAIILPLQVTIPVVLPASLAADLRRQYDAMAADHARFHFKHFDFDEWIIERLRDLAYGRGVAPEELSR